MSKPKQGSMRQVFNNIYQKLIHDEELMRLLYYFPEDANNPSPLSDVLDNMLDREDIWKIRDERVMIADKSNKIEGNPLCRLYISSGRRRPVHKSYVMATQEVVISVFVHDKYAKDMREQWISDRINELIVLEHIEGSFGKLEYARGNPFKGPIGYSQFDHTFVYSDSKK